MSIYTLLQEQGYCCCGAEQGTDVIATVCPKHGATVINCGGTLQYPLNDDQAQAHFNATGCSCRQSAGDNPHCVVHKQEIVKQRPTVAFCAYIGYTTHRQSYDSGIGCGDTSLLKTLEAIAHHVEYYKGLGPEYCITEIIITQECVRCSGEGKIIKRGPRSLKKVTCPDCRGKNSRIQILNTKEG